jgi:hypothetical protein
MKNDHSQKRSLSESSKESEQISGMTNSENDSQIQAYVEEFRNEVESKFSLSKANSLYRFPKIATSAENNRRKADNSLASLVDVSFYDLEAQNVKHELVECLKNTDMSNAEFLVEVIKMLAKLDRRYLTSQMKKPSSPLFQILSSSVNRNLPKNVSLPESKKSKLVIISKNKDKSNHLAKTLEFSPSPNKSNDPIGANQTLSQFPSLEMLAKASLKAKIDSDRQTNHMGYINTHISMVSPHSQRSHASYSTKNNSKPETTRVQGLLQKNFTGMGMANVKSIINRSTNNSVSALKNCTNLKGDSNYSMKKNIMHTNQNSNPEPKKQTKAKVATIKGSQFTLNASKSRSKEISKINPMVLANHTITSNNQISMTKDQLRTLIQKNIYKKTAQESELASNPKQADKSMSRSAKKAKEIGSASGGINMAHSLTKALKPKLIQRQPY